MSDDKTPIELAVDLFVYAPIGLALEARSLLPKLVERGRQQITGQVTMARVVGQFAVQQGRVEAGKRLAAAREQAEAAVSLFAGNGSATSGAGSGSPAGSGPAAATMSGTPAARAGGEPAGEPPPPSAPPVARRSAPAAEHLAIPGYDTLSASQVVPRLAGLAPEELEAVRSYEAETRGRKTILNRIAQLQA